MPRLTLQLTDAQADRLDRLVRLGECRDRAAAVGRALALYEMLQREAAAGTTVRLDRADGTTVVLELP